MKKIDKKPLLIGLIGGLIAALCCITPLVLLLIGLGSVSMILAFGKYGYVFFILGALFISVALWIYYQKTNKTCSVEDKKKQKYYILATLIIMVLVYVFIKYWLLDKIVIWVDR